MKNTLKEIVVGAALAGASLGITGCSHPPKQTQVPDEKPRLKIMISRSDLERLDRKTFDEKMDSCDSAKQELGPEQYEKANDLFYDVIKSAEPNIDVY